MDRVRASIIPAKQRRGTWVGDVDAACAWSPPSCSEFQPHEFQLPVLMSHLPHFVHLEGYVRSHVESNEDLFRASGIRMLYLH